jgi:hypothetical protein
MGQRAPRRLCPLPYALLSPPLAPLSLVRYHFADRPDHSVLSPFACLQAGRQAKRRVRPNTGFFVRPRADSE